MPQTRANKTVVPVNADAYNLTADLATFADSVGRPYIGSTAERAAIAAPYAGMEIIRTDVDYYRQRYDGSQWHFIGQPMRTWGDSSGFANTVGTGSRLIYTVPVPSKAYATTVTVTGQLTIFCPTISSGIEEINVAVSVAQAGVATAQGRSRLSWTAGLSNCNQSASATTGPVSIAASASPFARIWVEVITGAVSTTVSGGSYCYVYVDVMPTDD